VANKKLTCEKSVLKVVTDVLQIDYIMAHIKPIHEPQNVAKVNSLCDSVFRGATPPPILVSGSSPSYAKFMQLTGVHRAEANRLLKISLFKYRIPVVFLADLARDMAKKDAELLGRLLNSVAQSDFYYIQEVFHKYLVDHYNAPKKILTTEKELVKSFYEDADSLGSVYIPKVVENDCHFLDTDQSLSSTFP
jgi:hypothetical protein